MLVLSGRRFVTHQTQCERPKKKGGARKVVSTYKNDLRLIRATNLDNLVRIGNGKTVTTLRKKRNKKDKRSSRD